MKPAEVFDGSNKTQFLRWCPLIKRNLTLALQETLDRFKQREQDYGQVYQPAAPKYQFTKH